MKYIKRYSCKSTYIYKPYGNHRLKTYNKCTKTRKLHKYNTKENCKTTGKETKIKHRTTKISNYQKYTPINNHFKSQSKVSQPKDMMVDRIKINKTRSYAAYKRYTSELQKQIDLKVKEWKNISFK